MNGGRMKIPEMSEIVVIGPDGGFNTCKAVGAKVTDLTVQNMAEIRKRLVVSQFQSYWAPYGNFPGASGRIMLSPEPGIVGNDAKELQDALWMTSLGEDHYQSHVWRLYFWNMVYDILDKADIKDGAHVKVFTSLGLPHIHIGYADSLKASLTQNGPQYLSRQGGKSWFVTVDESLEVNTQPFFIMVDQVFKWTEKGLSYQEALLKGGLAVLDFGSKTLNGIKAVNNLVPVKHISANYGTWDIVKDVIGPEIDTLRQQRGISVGGIKWQSLMPVYETGVLKIGKHDPLDVTDAIKRINKERIEQRIGEVNANLDGGNGVNTIILAGGDVAANFEAFQDTYANNLDGDFRIATDDDGNEEPHFRQANGLLKSAVKAWMKSLYR